MTDTILPKIQTSKKNRFWDIFWAIFWILMIVLLLLKLFVYQQVTVVGASMEPNYSTGELLIVDQINKNLQRGQVVAVYEDKDVAKTADYFTRFQTRFFLKRIVALPGEEIEIVGSKVIIYNKQYPEGVVLKEDYISDLNKSKEDASKYYFPRTKITDKNYFCLGDNRTNSTDSRVKGTFPDYAIFGQETVRFWPQEKFTNFGLPKYEYQPLSEDIKTKIQDYSKKSRFEF